MKSAELLEQMTQMGADIVNVDLRGAQGKLMTEVVYLADGDDFWKNQYKMLLENVRGGIYPTTTDFKTVLQYPEGTDGLTDGIIVSSVTAEKRAKYLGVAFTYSFAEGVAELYWTVTFPSLGVASHGGMAPVCQNTEVLHWDLQEDVMETEGFLQVTWRCMDGDMVKSQVQKISVHPVGNIQLDWTVVDPVMKTPWHSYILVAYGRCAQELSRVDYMGPARLTPDGRGQELLLECGGKISCGEVIRSVHSPGIKLITENGMVASKGFRVGYLGKDVLYVQPREWKTAVPTRKRDSNDKAFLSLTIAVQFVNGEQVTLRLNSADSDQASQHGEHCVYQGSGSELRIHTLRILWDGVAAIT